MQWIIIEVDDTKAYLVTYIDEDEPKKGVKLFQKSPEADPTSVESELEEPELLKVEAFYLDYPD